MGKSWLRNVAGVTLAPFTAGLSLAGTTWAKNAWKDFSGQSAMEKANAANLAEAQKNRDWQERMSNTAITRQMQDLKNAGINPNLAATLGGASVGSGAQGQVSPVPSTSQTLAQGAETIASLGSGFSNIAGGLKSLTENKYIEQSTKANIANTVANTALTQAQTAGTEAGTQKTRAETEQIKSLKKQIDEETRGKKMGNDFNDFISLPDNAPQAIRYMNTLLTYSGVENDNLGVSQVIRKIKDFKSWLKQHDIKILPTSAKTLKQAWIMYKADGH